MLDAGVYLLAMSPFEAPFVSIAHTPGIMEQALNAAVKSLASL
jgi:glutamate-1-semialdehyde aminotransferase